MKGFVKCIIAGVVIIFIGAALFITGFALNGWNFKNDVNFTMQSYTAEYDDTAIDIKIDAGSLRTEFYDGDKIYVEYPVAKRYNTTVTESGGTLYLKSEYRFFFNFGNVNIPDTVVKLPQGSVFEVRTEMNAGSVTLADGKYGRVELEMNAGTFKTDALECPSLEIDIDAGTVSAGTVICDTLLLDMSAGTAKIADFTCGKTDIKASAGTIKLGFTGGMEEYGISTDVSAGSCNVSPQRGTTDKTIDIDISAGTVKLEFGV